MSFSIPNIPPLFFKLINSCNLDVKKAMLVALSNSVNNDIKNLSNTCINFDQYVVHKKQFLPDNHFDAEVFADVTELGLFKKSNKPLTQWLSLDSRDYCFSDNPRLKHPAKDITKYQGICKLMDLVNKESSTTQNADAALVLVYNNNNAGIGFHNDGEKLIDTNSSISTVSFGSSRSIEFCGRGKWPRIAEHSIEVCNHDLMVMKPGCQEHLVHKVCPGSTGQQPDDWRVVISFRKLSPIANEDSVADPDVSFDKITPPEKKEEEKEKVQPPVRVSLIAGDSFTAGLDAERLGRKKRANVINLSKGGATIQGVINQLNEFYTSNGNENVIVNKVFICVGANDIKNCRDDGIRHLKSPLVHLSKQVRLLFPDADVWFQNLMPLPLQHEFSIRNVQEYNKLVYEVCSFTKSYFLDIFEKFLSLDYRTGNYYRCESLFVNTSNVHPNKRGLGVLAKSYLRLIHSNRFNPLGY